MRISDYSETEQANLIRNLSPWGLVPVPLSAPNWYVIILSPKAKYNIHIARKGGWIVFSQPFPAGSTSTNLRTIHKEFPNCKLKNSLGKLSFKISILEDVSI